MTITTINPLVRSMKWEEDAIKQVAAAAARDTYYTLTDYTGKGILTQLGLYVPIAAYLSLMGAKITSDGNLHTFGDYSAINEIYYCYMRGFEYSMLGFSMHLEFTTSLKIEIANGNASTRDLSGVSSYSILSAEIEREILSANSKLPDRDYVYNQDVMCVHITGNASKLVFKSSPQVSLTIDSNGNVSGQLMKQEFGNPGVRGEDYTDGDSRMIWIPDYSDTTAVIDVDGLQYKVPLVKGKLEKGLVQSTVKFIEPEIIDLTK